MSHASPERRLWLAVLVQALADATTQSTGLEAQTARHRALAWMASARKDGDFTFVCNLAGIEPSRVQSALRAGDITKNILRRRGAGRRLR